MAKSKRSKPIANDAANNGNGNVPRYVARVMYFPPESRELAEFDAHAARQVPKPNGEGGNTSGFLHYLYRNWLRERAKV